MARVIAPHRMAPADAVRLGGWLRMFPDRIQEAVGDHIDNWDAATPLKLSRSVEVDIPMVRRKCELLPGDRIAAVAQWHSLRTALRGTGKSVVLSAAESEVEVEIDVPEGLSGGTLNLRTFLILDAASESGRPPFAAGKAGAILWQDRFSVALEGTGPRFPTEVRKFDSPLSAAGWMLDWRPSSPEVQFMGSVRLLLNEHQKAVVGAATAANRDLGQKLIVSAINVDVARSLLGGMLRNPDFVNAPAAFEKGTVGQVVGDLIASTFPGENLDTVRMQLENEPESFAARVQSRFKLFGVE
jgi:hypothetical protein